MGIMYINSSTRRGVRVRGRAKVMLRGRYGKSKKRRNPTLRYGEKKTRVRTSTKHRRKVGATKTARTGGRTRKRRVPAGLARYLAKHRRGSKKRRRNARSPKMAKKRKRKHSKRSHARRRYAKKTSAPRRRKRRSVKKSSHRRRRRSKKHSTHRRRRRSRKHTTHRRRRRSRRTRSRRRARRSRRSSHRSRRRSRRRTKVMVLGPGGKTLKYGMVANPRRRRRRRAHVHRHYRKHRRGRRAGRRYLVRSYRRNPGGFLIDLAKSALPVLVGYFGAQLIANFVGPMIPGVSALGSLSAPVVAVGTVALLNWASKHSAKLAEHKQSLLLGSMMAAINTTIAAFAPASVKTMLGMGDVYDRALSDYVQVSGVGDYVQVGGGMGDYVAIGDVSQELGIDQELGLDEELGDDLGGAPGGIDRNSLLQGVPTQSALAPVAAVSYTRPIGPAGSGYDNEDSLYTGVFAGKTLG